MKENMMDDKICKEFLADWQGKIGTESGPSPWIEITQEKVNQFAELTGDPQFIHVDPERAAAETPFGGTIAHGFFVLGLAVQMAQTCMQPASTQKMLINYGFDKIRFINPVPVGSRVRGRFTYLAIEEKNPGQFMTKTALKIEIEGVEKPAIVSQWLGMAFL